jgi:hypothetical protein
LQTVSRNHTTGLVVVGDLTGSGEAQERGVVGETPNLAARLQTLAQLGRETDSPLERTRFEPSVPLPRAAGQAVDCGAAFVNGDGWHPVGAVAASPLPQLEMRAHLDALKRLTEAEGAISWR